MQNYKNPSPRLLATISKERGLLKDWMITRDWHAYSEVDRTSTFINSRLISLQDSPHLGGYPSISWFFYNLVFRVLESYKKSVLILYFDSLSICYENSVSVILGGCVRYKYLSAGIRFKTVLRMPTSPLELDGFFLLMDHYLRNDFGYIHEECNPMSYNPPAAFKKFPEGFKIRHIQAGSASPYHSIMRLVCQSVHRCLIGRPSSSVYQEIKAGRKFERRNADRSYRLDSLLYESLNNYLFAKVHEIRDSYKLGEYRLPKDGVRNLLNMVKKK